MIMQHSRQHSKSECESRLQPKTWASQVRGEEDNRGGYSRFLTKAHHILGVRMHFVELHSDRQILYFWILIGYTLWCGTFSLLLFFLGPSFRSLLHPLSLLLWYYFPFPSPLSIPLLSSPLYPPLTCSLFPHSIPLAGVFEVNGMWLSWWKTSASCLLENSLQL